MSLFVTLHLLSTLLQPTMATSNTTNTTNTTITNANSAPKPSGSTSDSHRLSNGVVTGIVVAAAVGLALLTSLLTFLIMRRQQQSKGKRRNQPSRDKERTELNSTIPKKTYTTEASGGPGTYENYLPQSADNKTVQQRAKATWTRLSFTSKTSTATRLALPFNLNMQS